MDNSSVVRRINNRLAQSIEDIKVRIKAEIHIDLSFSECSEILAEKYFRGQLGVIPYVEIKKKYGSKKGWIGANI